MAVPSTAYKGTMTLNKANNTPIVHRAGVLHSNNTTHKTYFYLDDLCAFTLADGTFAWIGITFPGSVNHEMHAANRRGSGRKGSGVWLNDQFQTKGKVTAQVVVTPEIDNFIVKGTFRTAYYIPNGNVGARYRISYGGDGNYGQWFEDAEINESGRALWSLFDRNITLPSVIFTRTGFESRVQLQLYIVNAEGRNTFDTLLLSPVQLRPIKLRSQIGGAVTTYYTNYPDLVKASDVSNSVLVTKLYRSATGLPNSYVEQSGTFYHETNNNFSYVFGTGTVGGVTLTNYLLDIIDTSTPTLTFTPVMFKGFGVTTNAACQKASIPDEVIIYRRYDTANPGHPDNGKFYNNGIGSAFASNGYYIDYDGLLYNIMQLTNGVMTYTGNNCSI